MADGFAISLRKQRLAKLPSPIASGDYSASRLATADLRLHSFSILAVTKKS